MIHLIIPHPFFLVSFVFFFFCSVLLSVCCRTSGWICCFFNHFFFVVAFLCCSFQISFVDGCARVCACVCSRCCCLATPAFIFVAVLIIIITTAIHPFLGQFHDIASIIDFCLMRSLPLFVSTLSPHTFSVVVFIRLWLTHAHPPFFFFFFAPFALPCIILARLKIPCGIVLVNDC